MLLRHAIAYSAVVNYLDFSSITVPITFVNRDVDIHDTNRAVLNAKDAQIQTSCKEDSTYTAYTFSRVQTIPPPSTACQSVYKSCVAEQKKRLP